MKNEPNAAGTLTEADVEKFRRLMREECGVELSLVEAWTRATRLVAMFRALLGPIPEDPAAPGRGYPQGRPLARLP